jgi:hypothetical protein
MVECDPVDAMLGAVGTPMPERRRRQVEIDVRAALDEILRKQRPGQPDPPPSKLPPGRTGLRAGRQGVRRHEGRK